MRLYSTGEVATALNVSVSSIRNWTAENVIAEFLSDSATRTKDYEHAKERTYTENDLYVLNTINRKKSRSNTWDDVAAILRDGELDTNLPASAALVMQSNAAESFADALLLRQQLITASQTIEQLERELKETREYSAQNLKAVQDEVREREAELNRTIGRLEGQVEMLREILEKK